MFQVGGRQGSAYPIDRLNGFVNGRADGVRVGARRAGWVRHAGCSRQAVLEKDQPLPNIVVQFPCDPATLVLNRVGLPVPTERGSPTRRPALHNDKCSCHCGASVPTGGGVIGNAVIASTIPRAARSGCFMITLRSAALVRKPVSTIAAPGLPARVGLPERAGVPAPPGRGRAGPPAPGEAGPPEPLSTPHPRRRTSSAPSTPTRQPLPTRSSSRTTPSGEMAPSASSIVALLCALSCPSRAPMADPRA